MSIKFFTPSDENELTLEIKDINTSLMNSIRRICLEEFETVAFNIDDYINSDLKVVKNTSGLHNEFILSRMGLLPINIENVESFNPTKYKFVLKKENTTNNIINVTTEHIDVINTETGKKEDSKKFFPPNKNGSYILINKLKPNPTKGEEIHIEGKASKNNGRKNARYQPGFIVFSNKQDPEKVKTALEKYLSDNKDKDKVENLKRHFEISLADRYFYTDDNGECNYYNVSVESVGVIPPIKIFYNCLNILYSKLDKFKDKVNKIITEKFDDDDIKISVSLESMKAYQISIQNETHTLGNLIQNYSLKYFDRTQLPFMAYRNPHPLKNMIEFKISTETHSLEEVNNIINVTCSNLMNILDNMKKTVEKKL